MKTTVQLEWTDYLAVLRLNSRPTLTGTLVFFVFGVVLEYLWHGGQSQAILGGFGVVRIFVPLSLLFLYLLFEDAVLLPRRAREMFQQTREAQLPTEVELMPEGLRTTDVLGTVLWPWDRFAVWMDARQLLLFLDINLHQLILPKRALSEAWLAQMRTKIPATTRRPWRPRSSPLRGAVITFITLATYAMLLFLFAQPVP